MMETKFNFDEIIIEVDSEMSDYHAVEKTYLSKFKKADVHVEKDMGGKVYRLKISPSNKKK